MVMPIDYAQISSTEDQRPTVTTPVVVELNQNDSITLLVELNILQKILKT